MSASLQTTEGVYRRVAMLDHQGAPFPTVREIATDLGLGLATVHDALSALRRDGRVEMHTGWGLPRRRSDA